jgi:uncharacterized membrane protein
MNKMFVAVFNDEPTAYEGLDALKDLHADGDITLYASSVIVKDPSGAVSVKQSADEGPVGTALGTLTGSMVGLLGGPVGVAAGMSLGALSGAIYDLNKSGVDVEFVDDVSEVLLPGRAAVIADIDETWTTPVNHRIHLLGGIVFRRERSQVVEDQITRENAEFEAELDQLDQELAQAGADNKAAVQKQIDEVKKKIQATHAKSKARIEQLKTETDAKVAVLKEQAKTATADQKANIEKNAADLKEDTETRHVKLKQAAALTKQAMIG